jgi:septum site-determining protein MinC
MTTGYIDITEAQTPGDMVFLLSNSLETEEFNSKKIILNLGEMEVTQAQLLSLKSLINSVDSQIDFIYTKSLSTKLAALTIGISVANGEQREGTEESGDVQVNIETAYVPLSLDEGTEEEDEVESEQAFLDDETAEDADEKEYILDEEAKAFETVYVKQTLRSGQVVSHDGNVVIIGDCNPGSEVVASGDITIWGELKGIAHAGAQGNESAVIRALKIDAIQLRISSCYSRRPDRAEVEFSSAPTDTFTPEEARITDGEILIYTMNSKNK